jgi:hypothetical protein
MTRSHERAIAHVAGLADGGPGDPAWRVTLHFHPDRLVGGVPILRRMADDGVYRSQFETGTSNGGLTAFPGGDRWRWESRIFGGAYDDRPTCTAALTWARTSKPWSSIPATRHSRRGSGWAPWLVTTWQGSAARKCVGRGPGSEYPGPCATS